MKLPNHDHGNRELARERYLLQTGVWVSAPHELSIVFYMEAVVPSQNAMLEPSDAVTFWTLRIVRDRV